MEKRRLSLYGMIFFLCFFLIVSYFFSTHTVDYAKEADPSTNTLPVLETTTTSETATSIDEGPKESKEMTAFYAKITTLLNETAATFKGDVGISYLDLTTGKHLSVNGDKEFYTASTIKVPLTMLIADTVATGSKKWDDSISYNEEKDYEEGTGIIINNIQPSYSLRTLQEYSITYSDNIAKNMLYDVLGGDKKAKTELYRRFLGKTPNLEDPQFTSEDATKILATLYSEKATNPEYQTIYDYMKQTVFHERMDTALTKGKVAHKIGSYDDFIHDMGILETEHPFALAVFSKGQDGIPFISTVTDKLWTLQSNEYPK